MSTTFHNAQRKGFVKGGGTVYTCRCCGRKTRPTGTGDNDGVRLCVECYDLGGLDADVKFNRALWALADEMRKIKA